jgi:predicted dehydrogenase
MALSCTSGQRSAVRYQTLAVGIVGCGEIMQFAHLPIYSRLGVTIRRVFDAEPAKMTRVLERFPSARAASSVDELVGDPELDFIDIAIPPQQQVAVALAAITAGKHVLCQKPLAPTTTDAQRIVEAARERGVYLVVNHQMRWAPFIRYTADALQRGDLGALVHGRVNFLRPGRIATEHWLAKQPHLMCLFNTIHIIDALRFLFGEPRRISGLVRQDSRHAIAGETTVEAWLEWPTGAVVSITDRLSGRHQYTNTDIVLECERGTMLGRIGLWDRYPLPSPDIVRYQAVDAPEPTLVSDSQSWLPDAFAGPVTELAEAILHQRKPTTDGANALRNLAIVEAIYTSSTSGRSVATGEARSLSREP